MNVKGLLFDNWGIKLVSLGLSLTLWFYVTSMGKTEMSLTIPLELRNVPQGMAVVGDVTGHLDVRVQGQDRVLRDLSISKKITGIIDLSTARVGENTIHVSPDDIRRPVGVAVMYLSPPEIKVRLDQLVRKTVRLKPVLRGNPAPGYHIAGITVKPQKVSGEGPSSVMALIDQLQTVPIDIQGATENQEVEPRIDYQGKPVKLLDNAITVRIFIQRVNK